MVKRKFPIRKLIIALFCLTIIFVLSIPLNKANAASATNLNNYFHANGGTVNTYKGVAAKGNTDYSGISAEFTPASGDGVKNGEVIYNGLIDPATDLIIYFDNNVVKELDSYAMAIVYEDSLDSTQQLAFVSVRNVTWTGNGNPYSWSTMALTDDLELVTPNATDSWMKIAGTNQYLIGRQDTGSYTELGWTTWNGGNGGGVLYNGDLVYHINTAGDIKNGTTLLGNYKDTNFLTAASANLAGTEYADRYTADHVQNLFSSGLVKMKVVYYDIQTEKVDFHIRGIDGQWLADGASNYIDYSRSPYIDQKIDTLYTNVTYKMSDVFTYYHLNGFANIAAFVNSDTWGVGTFRAYGNVNQIDPNEFVDQEFEVPSMPANGIYNIRAYGHNHVSAAHFPEKVYTFNILEGKPTVSFKNEDLSFVKNYSYDLSELFDVRYIGTNASVVYKVDGTNVNDYQNFVPVNDNYTISCMVTDSRGLESEPCEKTVNVVNVTINQMQNFEAERGDLTYFSTPTIPESARYSIALFNAGDDITTAYPLTTNLYYAFETTGSYKLVYYIIVVDAEEPIIESTEFTATVIKKAPALIINGSYEKSYFKNAVINIAAATASNGYDDIFEVAISVVYNTQSVDFINNKLTLSNIGDYTISYSVYVDEDRTISEIFSISVIEDTEFPVILLNGTYGAIYEIDSNLAIIDAVVSDNSGSSPALTINVYLNDKAITYTDKTIKLDAAGSYKIIYNAVDAAGNESSKIVTFTVNKAADTGCSGCSGGMNSSSLLGIFLVAAAFAVFKISKL